MESTKKARRTIADGLSRGYGVMVLKINVLYVHSTALCIGLVFSGFVVLQRRYEELMKKA